MELCKTDKVNAFKLIMRQSRIIMQSLDISRLDAEDIADILKAQADVIDKCVAPSDTSSLNKARMAKQLSKKLNKKIRNDKK